MGQSSNSSNDNVVRALIETLTPQPPRPRVDSLVAWYLSQPPAPKPASHSLNLFAVAEALAPKPSSPDNTLAALFALGAPPVGNAFGRFPPSLVGNSLASNRPGNVPLPRPPVAYAPTRRKTFFSFHYADVIRVNNVRKSQEFRDTKSGLDIKFYDGSLWESVKLEGDEALKRLIRDGVQNTSVVCVLIGTETWTRPWVRYEIARSVIDKKALLAVDINGLNHHRDRVPCARGENPLAYMAVGKMRDGTYRLFEKRRAIVSGSWQWRWDRYDKYSGAIDLPRYLPAPYVDYVTPLDRGTMRYDFVLQQGHKNIGGWIDLAAINAGR